jgi:hypothetical protein
MRIERWDGRSSRGMRLNMLSTWRLNFSPIKTSQEVPKYRDDKKKKKDGTFSDFDSTELHWCLVLVKIIKLLLSNIPADNVFEEETNIEDEIIKSSRYAYSFLSLLLPGKKKTMV